MSSATQDIFQLGYAYSPVILTNGLANAVPGKMLPIIAITQAANFTLGLLNGTSPIDPNSFLAVFRPASGMTLIDNEIARYPFLNQAVAANARISQPLRVSLIMETRASTPSSMLTKLISFSALKAALNAHESMGGTYTVATPAYIYINCLLLQLRDISDTSQPSQPQNRWQWDFEQPLLTGQQAQQALNGLLSQIGGGLPTSSSVWSSIGNTVGQLAPTPLVQGASNLAGTAVTGIASSSTPSP